VNDSRVLFCPFCAEPFEGVARCPSHDLELITFRELSRLQEQSDQVRVPLRSLRFGRGALLAGAALTLIGFFCPLVRLSGQVEISNTLRDLAGGRAPRLWLVPAVALAVISVVLRRRTPAGMRGARLALCFLVLIPSALVATTLSGARDAAQLMTERLGAQVQVHWGAGAWLVWCAALPLLWGSLKFGVPAARRVR
jgi:hypothetical protein